jgi:hypothetical protein
LLNIQQENGDRENRGGRHDDLPRLAYRMETDARI